MTYCFVFFFLCTGSHGAEDGRRQKEDGVFQQHALREEGTGFILKANLAHCCTQEHRI